MIPLIALEVLMDYLTIGTLVRLSRVDRTILEIIRTSSIWRSALGGKRTNHSMYSVCRQIQTTRRCCECGALRARCLPLEAALSPRCSYSVCVCVACTDCPLNYRSLCSEHEFFRRLHTREWRASVPRVDLRLRRLPIILTRWGQRYYWRHHISALHA